MENAACNLGAIGPLLNKAGHPGTFDTEALTFLRHAHKLCDKAGLSLSDTIAINRDSDQYAALSTMPRKAYLDKVADLELLVAKRDAEIARLRAASAEKDDRIANLEAKPSDKVKIAELEEVCASKASQIETLKSHLVVMQKRLRETEAQRDRAKREETAKSVNEKVDVRPVTDPVKIDALGKEVGAGLVSHAEIIRVPVAAVAPELVWTDLVKAKLVEYASKGVSAATIGRRLARKFGGRVTSSIVTTMLRRLLIADAEGFLWASHWE